MTADHYTALIPMMVNLMSSPHYIVHTYAANAVERMLMVSLTFSFFIISDN